MGHIIRTPGRLFSLTSIYYGWVLAVALGITETVSYGILSYAFPVFIAPMESELGWSRTAITGAFSLALLISGLAAVPTGRWVDRHGARGVMTCGSVVSVVVLVGWSQVSSLAAFYVLTTCLGLAMAAVLYEPAFAVVANWFERYRGRALTVLTFIAGFASVIFVPLTALLVERWGWRLSLLGLAGIMAVVTIPIHAVLLRRRPEDVGLQPDGHNSPTPAASIEKSGASVQQVMRDPSFIWLCVGFSLAAMATTGIAVHLIPLLLERGHSGEFAGFTLGALGLMALPGRLIFTPLGDLLPRFAVTAGIFALSAVGLGALLTLDGTVGVWAFVALFGAGFGAITPARAALLADLYGRETYGTISGILALAIALARAAAPVSLSALYVRTGGYEWVLGILLGICAICAVAVLVAGTDSAFRAVCGQHPSELPSTE